MRLDTLDYRHAITCVITGWFWLGIASVGRGQLDQAGVGGDVNAVPESFRSLDADADGLLGMTEFRGFPGRDPSVLDCDFKVFDANGDGRLVPAEFRAIPFANASETRGPIVDPVVELARSYDQRLAESWSAWDADQDGRLSPSEFAAAEVPRQVPGLAGSGFADWDRDGDQAVSREDASQLLDVAFGIRTAEGRLLRSPTGCVVDWRLFNALDRDHDGRVSQ